MAWQRSEDGDEGCVDTVASDQLNDYFHTFTYPFPFPFPFCLFTTRSSTQPMPLFLFLFSSREPGKLPLVSKGNGVVPGSELNFRRLSISDVVQ